MLLIFYCELEYFILRYNLNLNLDLTICLSILHLSVNKNNKVACKGAQAFLPTCETGALWDQTWIEKLHDQNNKVSWIKLKSKYRNPCALSTLITLTFHYGVVLAHGYDNWLRAGRLGFNARSGQVILFDPRICLKIII